MTKAKAKGKGTVLNIAPFTGAQ